MASKRKIVLLGAGSHAVSVLDLDESSGQYSLVGLLDDRKHEGARFLDSVCLGPFES